MVLTNGARHWNVWKVMWPELPTVDWVKRVQAADSGAFDLLFEVRSTRFIR